MERKNAYIRHDQSYFFLVREYLGSRKDVTIISHCGKRVTLIDVTDVRKKDELSRELRQMGVDFIGDEKAAEELGKRMTGL